MEIDKIHFEVIDSTNTWAKEHIHEFVVDHLTLVVASEQSGGRGRFKRKWESPKGQNIYASFCFFVPEKFNDLGHIPQLMAISAAKILEAFGCKPKIKWPNDVLIDKKKIVGILCESVLVNGNRGIVCGIGLNVNMSKSLLDKIDRPATSLQAIFKTDFDVDFILTLLERQFEKDLVKFLKEGFSNFYSDYCARFLFLAGEPVSFNDDHQVVSGQFRSVNQDGSITLQLGNGKLQNFYSGEFVW